MSERGRIVHVIGTLEAGGAERFVVNLVCELQRGGWDMRLLALGGRTDAAGRRMRQDLEEAGVPLAVGPTTDIRLRSVLWYLGEMRRARPQLLHVHTPNTETMQLLVPPPWRPRSGVVRTVHNTNLDITDMHVFSTRHLAVGCSIFCSEASLEWNKAWVRGPSRVIPYGVRLDRPARSAGRAREAKRRLGLDSAQLHFLAMGRMEGDDEKACQKAHDVLLPAWRQSGVGARGARLHLLGDGNLRPRFEALAGGDPSILFHGVRGDVPDWLLAADCFVMPSRWEGLPVAGIEAVTTGLPCIFSRIQPLLELGPPVALWCEVDDVEGLSGALREFAAQPNEPTAEAVHAVRERFGIAHAADAYAEIYRGLGVEPGSLPRGEAT
jgi:glycosyltransferase involved in cell wall biosynthesis